MKTAQSFNLADLFESVAAAIPQKPAVVCGARRLTFAGLDHRANRLANALHARGIGSGDHVGLYLHNGTEYLEGMLAAFKLRAVPININYRYVENELAFLFNDANLAALIYQREYAPRIAHVKNSVSTLRTFIAVDDASLADIAPLGGALYEPTLEVAAAEPQAIKRSGSDQYIIYTGGTTGMPRGVIWRHEDVFFAGLQGGVPGGEPIVRPEELAMLALDREAPMTIFPAAPFIHGAAQWAGLIGLFSGGKVVLMPGRSFDPVRACELIAAEQVIAINLVGDAMARPFVEAIGRRAQALPDSPYDMASLMVVSSAGAVLSDSVKADLERQLPNALVLNSFGATETGHQGTIFPGQSSTKKSFFMDESSRVFDDSLKPIEPGSGQIGKLGRRGRVPVGYYNDPEKTRTTFVTIDGERWVLAGDLATVESDGMITVLGRGAVCINSGGEKVFPEEVESVLKGHPHVLDAIVVGVPDERWGERVAAVIQPRAGVTIAFTSIDAHCREHVAGYKTPRTICVVDEIVRQPSGKPDYRWAKEHLTKHLNGEA